MILLKKRKYCIFETEMIVKKPSKKEASNVERRKRRTQQKEQTRI